MKKVIKIIFVCVLIVATLGVVPLLIASSSSGSSSTMKAGKGIEIENKVVSIDNDTSATISECYENMLQCIEDIEDVRHQLIFEKGGDIYALQAKMSGVEDSIESITGSLADINSSLNTSVYPDLGFAKADIESLKSALSSLTTTVQTNRAYMDYLKNYISEESYLDLSTASDTLAHRLYTLEMSIPTDCSSDVSDLKNRVSALESSQSSGNEDFVRIIKNPGGSIYFNGDNVTDYSSIIIYDPDDYKRMSAPTLTMYVMFQPNSSSSDWYCGNVSFDLAVGSVDYASSGSFGIISGYIVDKQVLSDGYVEYSCVGLPWVQDMIVSASVSPCEEY